MSENLLDDKAYIIPQNRALAFEGRSNKFDAYPHFKKFLEQNPWYENSLDVVQEDYWAIFLTALQIGWELGYDRACEWNDYINADDD